jgi:hypothetical protein
MRLRAPQKLSRRRGDEKNVSFDGNRTLTSRTSRPSPVAIPAHKKKKKERKKEAERTQRQKKKKKGNNEIQVKNEGNKGV